MRKNSFKRLIAVVLSVTSLCGTSIIGYASVDGMANNDSGISPLYIAISTTHTRLSKNSNGSLNCEGATSVWSDNAGVMVELQRYDSGWTTIKSWSDYSSGYAAVDNDWYVSSGYSYRLKTTHYAYDSNWNQIESVVKYSNTL